MRWKVVGGAVERAELRYDVSRQRREETAVVRGMTADVAERARLTADAAEGLVVAVHVHGERDRGGAEPVNQSRSTCARVRRHVHARQTRPTGHSTNPWSIEYVPATAATIAPAMNNTLGAGLPQQEEQHHREEQQDQIPRELERPERVAGIGQAEPDDARPTGSTRA